MMLEHGIVIGREEILRPPPRTLALDHRIDGDVADPDLLHGCFAPAFLRQRNGRGSGVKPRAAMRNVPSPDCASLHPGYGPSSSDPQARRLLPGARDILRVAAAELVRPLG